MKNAGILILLMVILSSCGVTQYTTTTTTTYGDVTLLNNNGDVVGQWEGSTMSVEVTYTSLVYTSSYSSVSLKNSGLYFTDKNGESHYISGGIIIVDNIKTTTDTKSSENSQTKKINSSKSNRK